MKDLAKENQEIFLLQPLKTASLGTHRIKQSTCKWSGRSPGEGNGNLLQYSCLKIPWTGEPGGQTIHGDGKQSDMTG